VTAGGRDEGDGAARGVSSTIATVLMVAIVVLMATVTGAFLALQDDVERDPAPQVTFSFELNGDPDDQIAEWEIEVVWNPADQDSTVIISESSD